MTSPHRSFDITTDDKGSSISVQIYEQPGVVADNLSLTTWGSALVLANALHKIDIPSLQLESQSKDRSILELGAGTGLAGIAAAALWNADAVLSDLPAILPALDINISLNEKILSQCSVNTATLDWNQPSEMLLRSSNAGSQIIYAWKWKADVIIAADTLYTEEHPQLITQTIQAWLRPGSHSRAIICYALRVAYLDPIREFWELMGNAGFECLQEGRVDGDDDWMEVANTPYEWCVWGWKSGNET